MNYSILTPQELLRLAEPTTELERALMDALEPAITKADSAKQELYDSQQNYSDWTSPDERAVLDRELIDANYVIDKLRKRMDENDIDHDDI